jgi:hypothetical protein
MLVCVLGGLIALQPLTAGYVCKDTKNLFRSKEKDGKIGCFKSFAYLCSPNK